MENINGISQMLADLGSNARPRIRGVRRRAPASNSSRLSLRPVPLTRSSFLSQSSETHCDAGVDLGQAVIVIAAALAMVGADIVVLNHTATAVITAPVAASLTCLGKDPTQIRGDC
jgi:hypothetical protein